MVAKVVNFLPWGESSVVVNLVDPSYGGPEDIPVHFRVGALPAPRQHDIFDSVVERGAKSDRLPPRLARRRLLIIVRNSRPYARPVAFRHLVHLSLFILPRAARGWVEDLSNISFYSKIYIIYCARNNPFQRCAWNAHHSFRIEIIISSKVVVEVNNRMDQILA